jgi:hypothetical protein
MTSSAPEEYLIRVVLVGAVECQLVRTMAGSRFPAARHTKDPSNTDLAGSPICRSDVRSAIRSRLIR